MVDVLISNCEDAIFTCTPQKAAKTPGKEVVSCWICPVPHCQGSHRGWGGGGQSMVIAALDVSILTFTFSRKTNADHPVAVPLRAGVCRADPGRVADGSQGLG